MADSEYWLAFGDIHNDISTLERIAELPGAAGILVTGDLTFDGGIREAARVLEPVAKRCPVLLAQIGNMDRAEITGWLEEKGWNLHRRAREIFPGVMAIGVGCSPFTPFGTPSEHPDSQLAVWMEEGLAEAQTLAGHTAPVLVLVSHTPPLATSCDRLTSGVAAGSAGVRDFIERRQPALCLCGHIHESVGEDYIGSTRVINPGPLGRGGYVVLRRNGDRGIAAELKTV